MKTTAPLQNLAAKSQAPSSSTHAGLLLQRKCACGSPTALMTGECAECKSKKILQTKLSIGASYDPLEQEADRVADQVMAAPAHSAFSGTPPHIQRFTGQTTVQADNAPASVESVLASSGKPLEPALRQNMEQRFGHDFSRVRVHSGGAAEQSARDVNANAYAVGHDIVFGAGHFEPGLHKGRRLIAHELTHVVQQSRPATTSAFHQRGKGGSNAVSETNVSKTLIQRTGGSPSRPAMPQLPTKCIPGSTSLSCEVQAYRIDHPSLSEKTNLVAVEYTNPGVNEPQRKIFENLPGVAHSEEVMEQFFRDLRRSTGKEVEILKVYSERQPCGPAEHDCEGLLLRSERFKSAEKTFGYDYQEANRRVPGQGPYRAGEGRDRIAESHERLNETKNLEWDFQKKPTQPYHERKGPPSREGEGGGGSSFGGTPLKPPTSTGIPSALPGRVINPLAEDLTKDLGETLRLMRYSKVLTSVLRVVELVGSLFLVYQSMSIAENALEGKGFILTDKVDDAERLRDQANALAKQYPSFSESIESLGPTLYASGFNPDSIGPLLFKISDLGAEIQSQKIDLLKQHGRVKAALTEVSAKHQVAREWMNDPVRLAALDHGGSTLGSSTVILAEMDLSRIESALMQVDQVFSYVVGKMDANVEFLASWSSWLEEVGVGKGSLKPAATITTSIEELEELMNKPDPEDLDGPDPSRY